MENQGSGGPDLVVRAYVCKLHGRFERRVDSADVPQEVACSEMAWGVRCGLTSELVSDPGVTISVNLGGPYRIAKVDHEAMQAADGLGAAQVAHLEASIREAEQDVRGRIDDEVR